MHTDGEHTTCTCASARLGNVRTIANPAVAAPVHPSAIRPAHHSATHPAAAHAAAAIASFPASTVQDLLRLPDTSD